MENMEIGNMDHGETLGNGGEMELPNTAEGPELNRELGDLNENNEIGPTEELSDLQDEGLSLSVEIKELKAQIAEDREKIKELRLFLGSESKEIPADSKLQELLDKQDNLDKRMDALEKNILDAPRDGEIENLREEIDGNFKLNRENRDFAKEMKEAREEFVAQFIRDSIIYANRRWASKFFDAENGDQAKELVAAKLTFDIKKETREFIDKGGDYEIGWLGRLRCATFRTPNGREKMYITGFDLKVGGFIEGSNTEETNDARREDESDRAEQPLAA